MRKDKKMTLEEHLETADDLAIVAHHLTKIFDRCYKHYPNTHKLTKLLLKILPSMSGNVLNEIKSELDKEYHKVCSESDFKKYGHIYYNLDERYKK